MQNYIYLIILVCFLSSCAVQHKVAPIEYHHKNARLKSTDISKEESNIIDTDESNHVNYNSIPTLNENDIDKILDDIEDNPNEPNWQKRLDDPEYILPNSVDNQEQKILYHKVQMEETIEDIAALYEQSVQKIAHANNLSPPYELYNHQILKIMIPKNFKQPLKDMHKEESDTKSRNNANILAQSSLFIKPVQGQVISKFGEKSQHGTNKGINIAANSGAVVSSSTNGQVVYSDYDATFGNLVIIKLNNKNTYASYAHMNNVQVSRGQVVKQGDIIGYVGTSGKVSAPQLHFAIREGKIAKDPLKFIK